MRLFDILNEMDGEEQDGGDKRVRAQYDVAIQSSNPQEVVNALSDTKNYGIYAQTFRDPKRVEAVFGPSNPNQKLAAALKQWAGLDEDEKETNTIRDGKTTGTFSQVHWWCSISACGWKH